jgi:hypothetical protein
MAVESHPIAWQESAGASSPHTVGAPSQAAWRPRTTIVAGGEGSQGGGPGIWVETAAGVAVLGSHDCSRREGSMEARLRCSRLLMHVKCIHDLCSLLSHILSYLIVL